MLFAMALALPARAAELACVVAPPVVALVDGTGEARIPNGVYDDLFAVRDDALYAGGAPGAYRLLDARGNALSDEACEMFFDAGDAIIFRRGGLYGAMDAAGGVVLEPVWTQLASNGEGGFLALDGDPLDERPDEIVVVEPGAEPIRTGVLTASGLRTPGDGRMPYMAADGRWGAVDAHGAVAIPPTWRYVGDFLGGLAVAQSEFGRGVIDTDGGEVIETKYAWLDRGARFIAARTEGGGVDVYAPDGGERLFSLADGGWQAWIAGDSLAVANADESRLYSADGALLATASAGASFEPGLDGQVIVADGAWGERCQRVVDAAGADVTGLYQRLLPLCAGRYAFMTMAGTAYYSRDLGGVQTSWNYDSIRWGLLDDAGGELLPAEYLEIRPLANGLLLLVGAEAVSVADADGNPLHTWPVAESASSGDEAAAGTNG